MMVQLGCISADAYAKILKNKACVFPSNHPFQSTNLTCIDKAITVKCTKTSSEVNLISKPTEDQITILKTIHRIKKASVAELVRRLGEPFTVQDLTAYLKLLEQEKLLNRVQENPLAYELSILGLVTIGVLPEKAKNIVLPVPSEKCFLFYTGVGPNKFTKISACSLSDFREKVRKVDVKSLEFHIPRGDIEKWAKDVLGDLELAEEIGRVGRLKLNGELLRVRILNVIDSRIDQLTSTF